MENVYSELSIFGFKTMSKWSSQILPKMRIPFRISITNNTFSNLNSDMCPIRFAKEFLGSITSFASKRSAKILPNIYNTGDIVYNFDTIFRNISNTIFKGCPQHNRTFSFNLRSNLNPNSFSKSLIRIVFDYTFTYVKIVIFEGCPQQHANFCIPNRTTRKHKIKINNCLSFSSHTHNCRNLILKGCPH